MKNCLICQMDQDQVSLSRISIKSEGEPWGDILVCKNCMEMLGQDEVRDLVSIAVKEKAYDSTNVILANKGSMSNEDSNGQEPAAPGLLELPVSASLLRDSAAFARSVGEKLGGKLWEMHRGGASDAVWTTSLTPDGEGGFVLAVAFAKAPT